MGIEPTFPVFIMVTLLSWYFLAHLFLAVRARELSVPSSWNVRLSCTPLGGTVNSRIYSASVQNSTLKSPREERISRTAAAIDAFLKSDKFFTQEGSRLSFRVLPTNDSWPYGTFLERLADFDIYTNNDRYKKVVLDRYLPALESFEPDLR